MSDFNADELLLSRVEAIVVFENAMDEADREYRGAATATDRRGAAVKALTAVQAFMVACDLIHLQGPLVAVAGTIEAIDRGKSLPLLQKSQGIRGAPKVAFILQQQRAVVAAALEQKYREMKRLCGTEEAALDAAACQISRWISHVDIFDGVRKSDAGVGGHTIVKWREEVTSLNKDDLARQVTLITRIAIPYIPMHTWFHCTKGKRWSRNSIAGE